MQDSSWNGGFMKGSFDFCDLTPPATLPYIDWNTGTIDPDITYCETQLYNVTSQQSISIYPNPAKNILSIEPGHSDMETIILYDISVSQLSDFRCQFIGFQISDIRYRLTGLSVSR